MKFFYFRPQYLLLTLLMKKSTKKLKMLRLTVMMTRTHLTPTICWMLLQQLRKKLDLYLPRRSVSVSDQYLSSMFQSKVKVSEENLQFPNSIEKKKKKEIRLHINNRYSVLFYSFNCTNIV